MIYERYVSNEQKGLAKCGAVTWKECSMYLEADGAREATNVHLGVAQPAPRVTVETPAPFKARPLARVPQIMEEPFRSVCHIHVRTTKNGNSLGTGVLITRYHVLTCAHVLYPYQNPQPIEVTVLPGQSGPDDPRQRIRANGWAVSPGWFWNNCMTMDEDLAIIRLARPAGPDFWPIVPFDPSLLSGAAAYFAGYPGSREDLRATRMYRSQGYILGQIRIDSCTAPTQERDGTANGRPSTAIDDITKLIAHNLDSQPSMSGGPMWIFQKGRRVFVALHAGDVDEGRLKKAILLNTAVRRRIAEWIGRRLPPLRR
jgi:hypothetical protein